MEILYFLGALLFSILWFINLVQLLEKIHQGKNIHNQKLLGCVWSVGLTFSIIISISVFI
ncbi:hypothetical protein [Bacillus sp. Cr_A10]|uniref:hypothetical protein n=1 Tax=Bacillus sp. Cr_A10 TaxID=3033993 RepID=UPI0023DB3F2E|nr:hypothetical protein [Bacillus sp. Cr_A10]MDF2066820.1 hypothetical protein [Bacillus sp. Cr_A10]